MTDSPSEKLQTMITEALNRTLLHSRLDEREAAARAIWELFPRCRWEHGHIDRSTYANPDDRIPTRHLVLEAGHEQGELVWPQHGRAS